jgi:uncharacterized protein
MKGDDQNRIALITGGSSGIGRAIAHELAGRGFSILLVSNRQTDLEQCKTEIELRYSVTCHTFCIDLIQENSARIVYDYTQQQKLEVGLLVNNAGILVFSEMVETPLEQINAILQLHVRVPAMLCKLFGSRMKQWRGGHILNVASISSVMPYPGISIYGPSKTYLRYFTRALRSEMKIYGVNITCLIPGATETALYDPNRVNLKLAMKFGVMHSPAFVAQKAIHALFRNKAECIPGWLNKITVRLIPFIPMQLIFLIHRNTNLLHKTNANQV